MKNLRRYGWAAWLSVVFVLTLSAGSARAALFTSQAATMGDWSQPSTWTNNAVPGDGDDVEITNAGSVVTLSSASSNLNSLLLSQNLVFTNWGTQLNATNVTVASGGKVSMPAAFTDTDMSNNIVIACSNFTLDAGGLVEANSLGYLGGTGAGYGPGKGASSYSTGAGHGGYGGKFSPGGGWAGLLGGSPYDLTNAPVCPGSSGSGYSPATGGSGGGAVRIAATGNVTVNGTIRADGGNGIVNYTGAGSGGSIWISCATIAGTSGVVSANGGAAPDWAGGGGGGGRIAVTYNTAAQAATGKPRITFTATYGANLGGFPDQDGTPGTLYFPDAAMLDGAWFPHSGQIILDAPEWKPDTLVVSNVWAFFPMEGFRLTVTNDVRIEGASARLYIGGNVYWPMAGGAGYPGGAPFFYSSMTSFPALNVGGSLTLTNGGKLCVYGAQTDSTTPDYGALISVTGSVLVAGNCSVISRSHPSNGGSPLFRADSITVLTNGTVDASAKGFMANYGPGCSGAWSSGGGYGGRGGPYHSGGLEGPTYGSSNAPIQPGSGGAGYENLAGRGGGLVRIEASDTVRIDGIVYAQGGYGASSWSGGGSGGGIFIRCRNFAGNPGGLLYAVGGGGQGSAQACNSGGGGRIAVWRQRHSFQGTVDVANGAASGYADNGQPGTIVWGQLPLPGTIVTIH